MHSFRNGAPRALLALLIGVPSVAWLTSCSPSSGQATGLGQSGNGDGSGSSSGSSGGANTSGGGNGSGANGSLFSSDTGGSSSTFGGGADAGCQTEVHEGERQAVDLYFILDQSGSMADDNPSKWSAVSTSLTAFLNDPANDGTGAGIGYFPVTSGGGSSGVSCTSGQPGCTCFFGFCFNASAITNAGGSCTASDYAKPDVPIAQLPAVGPAIATSLQAHGPNGGTPTYPALQGTYQYAATWAVANPGRKTVVVLATDGDPTGCDADNQVGSATTTGSIAGDLVAPAYAGNPTANPPVPSIPTFVIGVGSSLTSLNNLAAAGGTGQAFIVDDSSGNVAQQFAAALDKIRGQAVSCDFGIPNDGTVDPTKVNATYTAPNSTAPLDIYSVADVSHCSTTSNDWYYNSDQTKLTLCPNVCQTLASGGGSVQVVLGCPTVEQPIN